MRRNKWSPLTEEGGVKAWTQFAAAALQGRIAQDHLEKYTAQQLVFQAAYCADCMLAELQKRIE